MRTCLQVIVSSVVVASGLVCDAQAQTTPSVGTSKANDDIHNSATPALPLGFELPDGARLVPQAFSEIGADTNPDFTSKSNPSAYSRTGVGFGLNVAQKDLVANAWAGGSWLDYFSAVDRPERLSGSANVAMTYLLRPGWTLSGSSFIDADRQSFNKTQSDGSTFETIYRQEGWMTAFKGGVTEIRYLNGDASIYNPLLLTSALDFRRTEGVVSGLYTLTPRLSVYTQGAAARVDYTDQPNPTLINRSADDFYAKSGLRIMFSPTLFSDLGWRVNWRNLDDQIVHSFESNGFDGALSWRPSPFFALTGSIQRFVGEPTTSIGRLADTQQYDAKVTFSPVAGVNLTLGAMKQFVNEVGSGTHYRSDTFYSTVKYDYSERLQFYTTAQYESLSDFALFDDRDRFRILGGIRWIPDGKPTLPLDASGGYKDFVPTEGWRLPEGATLSTSLGYSWLNLPSMQMVTLVGGPFWNRSVGAFTNDDGGLNGGRLDVSLENFASHQLASGQQLLFNLTGFYSHFEGTQLSRCVYTDRSDCAFINIVDVSPHAENNTGPFGDLHISTYMNVDYFGVAVDVRLSDIVGGYKDVPTALVSPLRVGLGYRGLLERTKLTSIDALVCAPVRYDEWLNTHYFGTFVGYNRSFPLGASGWLLSLDGTAGIYYANSEYRGRYSGYAWNDFAQSYVSDFGATSNSASHGAFIGTLKVGFNKDLGWGGVGIFGQLDYLGYAPKIAFNNNDIAGPAPWGLVGDNAATHITADSATNYTVGLNLTVKLDRDR